MNRVLVAYDGSPASRAALERAFSLFRDSDVTVISVLAPPELSARVQASAEARQAQQRLLEEARQLLREHGVEAKALAPVGDPAEEILAAARDMAANVIVLGHEHHRLPHPRSISGGLARRAECDVLLVHAGTAGADGRDELAGDDH